MRTNKYRYINSNEIKAGWTIDFDPITGAAKHKREKDAEGGWVASFELRGSFQDGNYSPGLSKTLYMTHSEIDEHKEKYAKGFNRKDSAWQTSEKQMKRKTVLRQLLQTWGVFDQTDKEILTALEEEQGDIVDVVPQHESLKLDDSVSVDESFPPEEKADDEYADLDAMSQEEILKNLGVDK